MGARLLIKICGVTRPEDALACALAGADAVGLNFYPPSPRCLGPQQAAALAAVLSAQAPQVLRVGVFVNAQPEQVLLALQAGWIHVAQLHGDEDPAVAGALSGRLWKGLHLSGPGDLVRMALYDASRWERLVIDAPSTGYGGSGRRIDTELAALAARQREVILAGGLAPDNVFQAVCAVRPAGIDVASGVESSPGRKDPAKVQALIAAARAAQEACATS